MLVVILWVYVAGLLERCDLVVKLSLRLLLQMLRVHLLVLVGLEVSRPLPIEIARALT